jgi:ATP-dependent Zn protease
MTPARYSRRVVASPTGNCREWNPTIGGTRLGTCRRVRLDGPLLPRALSAYHEAAHAVVAWKLGCTVERIDITAAAAQGGQCVHITPDSYRVPGSRRIPGTSFRQETTEQERATMALRQRDVSTATAALAGVALEDIARVVPALALLPASETLNGTTHEGQQHRSRSDIRTAADAARRQHQTDAGRNQFFGRARARAAKIMIRNWPAMTALAEALLEQGTLDGQEVDRLMQAATGHRSSRSRSKSSSGVTE